MQKEFLYEATIVDNPFDLIERDIAMYGEEYLKSMDDSEFLLNYGMTRKEYLFDFRSEIADYSSNKLEGIRRNTPFTEQSLSNLIEGYKSETIKHLSAVRITSGQSPAKKPSEAQLNNRTSVKPSELKQKIAQKAQQQINQAQEAVSDTVEDIKGNVGDVQQKIENNINKATEFVGNKAGPLKGLVNKKANQVTKPIRGKVNEVGNQINSQAGQAGNKVNQQLNRAKNAVGKQAKKLPYPASNIGDASSEVQKTMKKEFATLKKSLLREARGPFARKALNLREKALKNAMLEEGISYGSPEFAELAQRFFPGIQTQSTVNQANTKQTSAEQEDTNVAIPPEAGQETAAQSETETAPAATEKQQVEAETNTTEAGANSDTETQSSNNQVQGQTTTTSQKTKKSGGGGLAVFDPGNQTDDSPAVEQEMADMSKAETLPEGQDFVQGVQGKKPTSFMSLMKNSETPLQSSQEAKEDKISEKIPEIDTPTGLEAEQQETNEREKGDLPDKKSDFNPRAPVKESGNKITEQIVTPTPIPTAPVIDQTFNDSETQEESIEKVKEMVGRLPTNDESVNTSPGTPPNVPLTGEADPAQTEQAKNDADQETQAKKTEADEAASVEVPTETILPPSDDEQLTSELSDLEAPPTVGEELELPEEVPAEIQQSFDQNAQAHLDEQASEEYAKNDQALADLDEQTEQETQNTLDKIDSETENTRQQQLDAQNQAKTETDQHKSDWQKENQAVMEDFETQAQQEYGATQADIDQKVSDANSETQTIYTDAEQEAQSEQSKAEVQAQEEQDKAKNQKKSFWDKLTDAVSSFFDKVKKALNSIFDALRAAVKKIIDEAKKLAAKVIDMARDFIVSAIKLFGEVLKKLVSVALAAFPELAKKFNDLIDKAVNKAIETVNKLAEALKTAVNALLDLLGAVLDKILAAYQAVLNAILDVLEFIAVGIIKILQGLANLGIALYKGITDYFMGAMVEEAIGTDVTKPLNVERTDAEIAAHEQGAPMPGNETQPVEQTPQDEQQQNEEVLNKPELSDTDVQLPEGPGEISPELLKNLPQIDIGQSIELGTNSAPITREQIQAAFASGGENVDGIADSIADSVAADAQAQHEMQGQEEVTSPDWENMNDDEKLQYYLNQMGGEPAAPEGSAQGGGEQSGGEAHSDIPYIAKTGRLTVGKRLSFVGQQMLKGMKMWWSANKVKIYAAIIGILIGAGVIAFFTGGAGLIAVLQVLMQVLTAYFIADAILRIKDHFYAYLEKAWGGDTEGGGKSLAKALAILISEFVFEYLLKVVGKVLKKIKNALKASKKVSRFAKTATRVTKVVKNIGKKVKNVGIKIKNVILKRGKFIFEGLNKAWLRVVNTVGDLRQKILKRFGFKRMWIEKSGKYIELWAEFNPKVLLMKTDGDDLKFDTRDLKPADRIKLNNLDDMFSGTKKEVGRSLSANEIIVTDSFADTFKKMDFDEQQRIFKELQEMSPEDIRKLTGGSNPPKWLDDPEIPQSVKEVFYKRGDLRKKLDTPSGQNAHHINPIDSLGNNKVLQDAVENGYKYNDVGNGINLERYSSKLDTPNASPTGTHASHPNYSNGVNSVHEKFESIFMNSGNYNPNVDAKLYTEIFTEKLRIKLETHCAPGINPAVRLKVDELFQHINIDSFYDEIMIEFFKRRK